MRHVRPLSLALLSVALAFAAAACTTAEVGWTYAPAPSKTPAPSGAASAGASGSPAASSATNVIQISAAGIKFEQATVTVPASTPFQISFENKDPGTPHNIHVHTGDPTGPTIFEGATFNGVETRVYDVPALDPGAYSFVCSIHPTMIVAVTAQ